LAKKLFTLIESKYLIDSQSNLDPTFLDKVPIFSYLLKGYSFEQITGLKK